jgi:hypothetical protein
MPLTFHGLIFDVDAEPGPTGGHLLRHPSGPQWPIQLSSRPLGEQGFEQAVKMERAKVAAELSDAKVLERTHLTLAGAPTWVFAHTGLSADGVATRQLLALLHCDEHVITLRTAGIEEEGDGVRNRFEQLLIGLRAIDDDAG